jgi:hypothetical protein
MAQSGQRDQQRPLIQSDDKLPDANVHQNKRRVLFGNLDLCRV